jgi:hypothetical protein
MLLVSRFDDKVTKIETVQNCYIAVSGCPGRRLDHALQCLQLAVQVFYHTIPHNPHPTLNGIEVKHRKPRSSAYFGQSDGGNLKPWQ